MCILCAVFSYPDRRMSSKVATVLGIKSFLLLVVIFASSRPCCGQGDYIVIAWCILCSEYMDIILVLLFVQMEVAL